MDETMQFPMIAEIAGVGSVTRRLYPRERQKDTCDTIERLYGQVDRDFVSAIGYWPSYCSISRSKASRSSEFVHVVIRSPDPGGFEVGSAIAVFAKEVKKSGVLVLCAQLYPSLSKYALASFVEPK